MPHSYHKQDHGHEHAKASCVQICEDQPSPGKVCHTGANDVYWAKPLKGEKVVLGQQNTRDLLSLCSWSAARKQS